MTYLVEVLRDGTKDAKSDSARCLANLACKPTWLGALFLVDDESCFNAVWEVGKKALLSNINLVSYLDELLRDGTEETKVHSARCLANLAGQSC